MDFRTSFRSAKTMLSRTPMRQTAATAVPLGDFLTKPQRECKKNNHKTKTIRNPEKKKKGAEDK